MARVPAVTQSDLPEDYQYLMSEDALGERNLFTTMGNNPAILKSYMLYGTTLWNECGLSAHDRELVILAVGRALDSEYEWEQHVDIGAVEDVSTEAMSAIGRDELDYFDEDIEALLAYAQAFARNEVTDEVYAPLEEHFDPETIVGVTMLASHYVATGFMLDALDVQLELDEFVGWEPTEEDVEKLQ